MTERLTPAKRRSRFAVVPDTAANDSSAGLTIVETVGSEAALTALGADHHPPALMFGIPVDDLTMAETLDRIGEMVVEGRRSGRSHQVATLNVDFLVNAVKTPWLHEVLQSVDLAMADGQPLIWGSRWIGTPIRGRVTGADLVERLAERCAQKGWRLHLFGSGPGVGERAAELLGERYPGLTVTSDEGPVISAEAEFDHHVVARIRRYRPDVLCVALGNPKQERFIMNHRDALGVPVLIGVGGSLDMLVGDRRRAPLWMQRAGLEWVYRMSQEPRRLGKRYAKDAAVFGPRMLAYVARTWRYRDGEHLDIGIAVDRVTPFGVAPGTARSSWRDAAWAVKAGAPLEIDLGRIDRLSTAAMSQLCGLVRLADGTVRVTGEPSAAFARQLRIFGKPSRFARNAPMQDSSNAISITLPEWQRRRIS